MPTPREAAPPAVSWSSVALPVEHGGWGFLLEPLALGLVLAPSPGGLALAPAALCAFLARHPLRLLLMDRRRGTPYPRTALAARFLLAYLVGALALLALGLVLARSAVWPALVAAAPFALVALWYDAAGRSREAEAETSGAVALSGAAAAIALAGGARPGAAGSAAALMALRAVASVVYVRARIRLDRGKAAGPATALFVHAAALAAAIAMALAGWAPRLSILAFLVLLARAGFGLSSRRRVVPPRVLGFAEMRYGLLVLALLAIGYRLGL
ncbi:MAG TPA: YwiC-like family protein [Vicinamibacteria bacterium]|nr:YwiC-like family protein [Vicinamibacteria bacterium]